MERPQAIVPFKVSNIKELHRQSQPAMLVDGCIVIVGPPQRADVRLAFREHGRSEDDSFDRCITIMCVLEYLRRTIEEEV